LAENDTDCELIYKPILVKLLNASCSQTVVDPSSSTPESRAACPNSIMNIFAPDVLFQVEGVGSFSGPTIASEYTCVNGVQILIPGSLFYSVDEIVESFAIQNVLYFNSTFSMASKFPTNGWNSTSHFWASGRPEPYAVSVSTKRIQFNINGRITFNKDNLISLANINLGNVIGILSLLQQVEPSDPYYQAVAFCLSIKDACTEWAANNSQVFGYGDPTQPTFLQSCLGTLADAQLPFTGSPFFGSNSFTCRAYHLGMAFISPEIHCPHSALESTVCTGTEVFFTAI